jgi:hypothetical protein
VTEENVAGHDRNNRQFFRVYDVMGVEYSVIEEDSLHAKKREIHQKQLFETHDRSPKDAQLRLDPSDFEKKSTLFIARALLQLNHKMDELIALQREEHEDHKNVPPIPLVLSASGMRFASNEKYESGIYLHVVLHLNVVPTRKVDLFAETVRNVENTDEGKWGEFRNTVAVKFLEIRDDIKEELVRYVFKIQRDGLRQQDISDG